MLIEFLFSHCVHLQVSSERWRLLGVKTLFFRVSNKDFNLQQQQQQPFCATDAWHPNQIEPCVSDTLEIEDNCVWLTSLRKQKEAPTARVCVCVCTYMRLLHKNNEFFPASSRAVSTTLIDNWMEDTLLCVVDGPRLCLNFNDPSKRREEERERGSLAPNTLFSLFIARPGQSATDDSFVHDVSMFDDDSALYEPITFVRLTNYWYFARCSHVNGRASVNVFVSKGIFCGLRRKLHWR
jgi:hypothetical protein